MAILRVRMDLLLHHFDEFGMVWLFHANPVVADFAAKARGSCISA
jgi:hypothetical protein